MPSRSNPNTPTSLKRKTARALQTKRESNRRLVRNRITKPIPRTSQAIRRAAPLSQKKIRKLERKQGYLRRRKMEETGEVEMRDADVTLEKTEKPGDDKDILMDVEEPAQMMEIDEAREKGEGENIG